MGFWCSVALVPLQLGRADGDWGVHRAEPSRGLPRQTDAPRRSRALPPAWCCYRSREILAALLPLPAFQTRLRISSTAPSWGRCHGKPGRLNATSLSAHKKLGGGRGERGPLRAEGLTLPVKLLADPFAPLFAQIPEPARVANVSALERNLKAKEKGSGEKRSYCLAMLQQWICSRETPRPHQRCWEGLRAPFRDWASPKYAFWGKSIYLSHKQNLHSALCFTIVRTRGGPDSKAAKSFGYSLQGISQQKPQAGSCWLPGSASAADDKEGKSQAGVRLFGHRFPAVSVSDLASHFNYASS